MVAEGTISPSDLRAWAMRDHALYQYTMGLPELRAGKEYLLTTQMDQANTAINGLSPTLQVHTWGSLKGRYLVDWKPRYTFVFCFSGLVLLAMAYARYACDRRPSGQP